MSEIKVAVIGAAGRMGSQVCAAADAADGLELVGRFDQGDELGDLGGADVVVEFSVPDASPGQRRRTASSRACTSSSAPPGGTTSALEALREQARRAPGVGVLIAPNFAIGAILMMRFAQQAARFYESVEVVELHHPDKVDAPSGTAARTAGLIAAARRDAGLGDVPDATTTDPDGARGARVDGIPVHSVRLRGLVAHQEVLFGGDGRDADDPARLVRPGVASCPACSQAVRRSAAHPGLTVGLEHYLGLDDGRWKVREKVTALVLLVVLGFYCATIGWRGVVLVRDGRPWRCCSASR